MTQYRLPPHSNVKIWCSKEKTSYIQYLDWPLTYSPSQCLLSRIQKILANDGVISCTAFEPLDLQDLSKIFLFGHASRFTQRLISDLVHADVLYGWT